MNFIGEVFDAATGDPLVGAHIVFVDALGSVIYSKDGTTTDADGQFTMTLEPQDRLRISYIGYQDEEYQHQQFVQSEMFVLDPSTEVMGVAEVTAKRNPWISRILIILFVIVLVYAFSESRQ